MFVFYISSRWFAHATRNAGQNSTTADCIYIATIIGIREAIQAEQIFVQAETFRSCQLFAFVRNAGKYSFPSIESNSIENLPINFQI